MIIKACQRRIVGTVWVTCIEEGPKWKSLDQGSSTPVLESHKPVCLKCLYASAQHIHMNGSLSALCIPGWHDDDNPFIWISCAEAGKHLSHAGLQLLRTAVEDSWPRLIWFEHKRRDSGWTGRRMLKIELPGRRKRGRPKRRFLDVVKEDMQLCVCVTVEKENRVRWKQQPQKVKAKRRWWHRDDRIHSFV